MVNHPLHRLFVPLFCPFTYHSLIWLNNSLDVLKSPDITLLAEVSGDGTITLNDSLSNYRYLYANFGTVNDRFGSQTYLPINFIKNLNSIFINAIEKGDDFYAYAKLTNITDTSIVITNFTKAVNWKMGIFYLYGIK